MKEITFLRDLLLQLVCFKSTESNLELCVANVFSRGDGMLKVNY